MKHDIKLGYHEESRATHLDGIYHKAFLEHRAELEKAVNHLIDLRLKI